MDRSDDTPWITGNRSADAPARPTQPAPEAPC